MSILCAVIGESLRIAFNGSALLSPLTGVGQYSKTLAEDLVASGQAQLSLFYAAIRSKDIRTGPIREIGAIKEFIKKVVPHPYAASAQFSSGDSIWVLRQSVASEIWKDAIVSRD